VNKINYQKINEQFIKYLNSDKFKNEKSFNCANIIPLRENLKPYTGVNMFILWMQDKPNPVWMGPKTALKHGINIKGASCVKILIPKVVKDHETDESMCVGFFTGNVLNLSDCTNIPEKYAKLQNTTFKNEEKRHAELDAFFAAQNIEFVIGNGTPCYMLNKDCIRMPDYSEFKSARSYYSIKAHEYIHATGHDTRLKRTMVGNKNTKSYAFEELIAEIGSAFVTAHFGLDSKVKDDNIAYVNHWIGFLKKDEKFIIEASRKAQNAFEYMLHKYELSQKIAA